MMERDKTTVPPPTVTAEFTIKDAETDADGSEPGLQGQGSWSSQGDRAVVEATSRRRGS